MVFLSALKEGTLPTPFTASRTTLIGIIPKMKSTRIPVLPITESFPHAWIDRAMRFQTAGRKNSRKSWINAARSDVGRFRFEIHSRGLQARLSGLLLQQNRDLCATYKWHNMVVGRNIENPEQGKRGISSWGWGADSRSTARRFAVQLRGSSQVRARPSWNTRGALMASGCNTRPRTSAMCSTGIRSMPLCWD